MVWTRYADAVTGALGGAPDFKGTMNVCEGCIKIMWTRYADATTGALSGAPCGATKRVRDAPKVCGPGMREQPLGP
eukprot:6061034-Pyramimonas_sp.AAC.1